MNATENKMLETLEEARIESVTGGRRHAMGNGMEIEALSDAEFKRFGEKFKKEGWWTVAIFEHGHRVEA